jgi:pimeloyl-ACP methyl ester carboxylesterase
VESQGSDGSTRTCQGWAAPRLLSGFAAPTTSWRCCDDVFRSYFVIQTREMLDRYERFVAPAAAGRLDSTVGYAAACDLLDHDPGATLAVIDDAGHALPQEQPALVRALISHWITRVERGSQWATLGR